MDEWNQQFTGEGRSATSEQVEAKARFTDAEYRMAMDCLCSVVGVLSRLPLDAMLETIERAETVGPILYPTEFVRSGQSLTQQRRLLEAAKRIREMIDQIGA